MTYTPLSEPCRTTLGLSAVGRKGPQRIPGRLKSACIGIKHGRHLAAALGPVGPIQLETGARSAILRLRRSIGSAVYRPRHLMADGCTGPSV